MTDRDELIAAGLAVWPKGTTTQRYAVETILDAVEPLIRADERERDPLTKEVKRAGAEAVLADLRARVEGMWLMSDADHDYNDGYEAAKREFLDILDGVES